jgi:amino-acid N-acetyltransferase
MLIRRATVRDIPGVGQIINDCAEYGIMLHRSLSFLYEHVRDFQVAVAPGSPGAPGSRGEGQDERVVGCCGLSIVWGNLAEIYSLAVAPGSRKAGLGRRLVEACVEDARRLGVRRLMALTYEHGFFAKLRFAVVDRQTLPLKVWSECLRCPKNQACDEIAMVRVLEEVAEAPTPVETSAGGSADKTGGVTSGGGGDYFVPVVLRSLVPGAPPTPDPAKAAPGA